MTNENHFSPRLLTLAAKVKNAIDLTFSFVTHTATTPQSDTVKIPVNENPRKWKNAEIFAREFKVNRNELQSAFKYCYHKGIGEYGTERKMEAACILLSKAEMTIKEIAVELDFDQEYFSSLFKKRMGMRPTEWQKKNWKEKNILTAGVNFTAT